MPIAFFGLGSNRGNRSANIERAAACLEEHNIKILAQSTVIETEPVDGPPQEKYLNAVLKAETILPPEQLLFLTQSIEKKMGRIKTVLNGPRVIDIDILLYDKIKMNTPSLTIPHPRMSQRDFVLVPLREIAPDIIDNYYARH